MIERGEKKYVHVGSLGSGTATWFQKHGKTVKPKLSSKQAEDMAHCFSIFDADDSGEIDQYEIYQALRMIGMHITPSECAAIVKVYDTNGSGALSFDEFVEMTTDRMALQNGQDNQSGESDTQSVTAMSGISPFAQSLRRRALLTKIIEGDHEARDKLYLAALAHNREIEPPRMQRAALARPRKSSSFGMPINEDVERRGGATHRGRLETTTPENVRARGLTSAAQTAVKVPQALGIDPLSKVRYAQPMGLHISKVVDEYKRFREECQTHTSYPQHRSENPRAQRQALAPVMADTYLSDDGSPSLSPPHPQRPSIQENSAVPPKPLKPEDLLRALTPNLLGGQNGPRKPLLPPLQILESSKPSPPVNPRLSGARKARRAVRRLTALNMLSPAKRQQRVLSPHADDAELLSCVQVQGTALVCSERKVRGSELT